ncbi:MAG: hypothetical protein ACO1PW_13160, partial [Actinomycetota bacterium]
TTTTDDPTTTTTTEPTTTTSEAPTTSTPESTTTTESVVTISNEDSGPSDGTLIGIVVAGLVLIALVVSVLTWRYWLATRPLPIEADGHPAPAG